MRALSQTPYAAVLLRGPATRGLSMGHGHLLFGDPERLPASGIRVLSLTRPGHLRMPNGIECDLPEPEPQAPVMAGNGRLECDLGMVELGPMWNPKPRPRCVVRTRTGRPVDVPSLVGLGPGLTPLGDDVIVGYLAAATLFRKEDLSGLAGRLGARTTSLSATLLRLAAQGELPEAAHRLLETADPAPLLSWGATSGSGLLAGLGLHNNHRGRGRVQSIELTLPLDPLRRVTVEIQH